MKQRLLILSFIAFAFVLSADTLTWESASYQLLTTQEILQKNALVDSKRYFNADEVKLALRTEIRYEKDGRYFQVSDIATKILTDKGRDANRVVSSYYGSSYSRAKIPLVEIIRPARKANQQPQVISVDLAKNTKEMVDTEQMEHRIYDWDSKIIKVSVPNLQKGDILHCVYVDEVTTPRIPGVFSDFISLEDTAPIIQGRIIIDGPAALPLANIAVKDKCGAGPEFSKVVLQDRIRYEWTVSDVPQVFPEPRMPSSALCCQRLLVSTAKDWEELSRWYYNLCQPHLKSNDAIQQKSRQLIDGCTTFESRVRAIYTFVSQNIRYMGMIDKTENKAPGYEPHDVTKTFAEKAGVCRDKAVLLVAMLQSVGIEAYPVLIHAGPLRDSEVPMTAFNHAITAARNPATGEYVLMDSTDESSRNLLPSYLSEKSYLIATKYGESLRTTAVTPHTENLVRIQNNGEIDINGKLTLTSFIEFDGINDNAYRGTLLEMSEAERREALVKILNKGLPGAELLSFEITPKELQDTSDSLKISLVCTVPDTLITSIDNKGQIELASHKPILLAMPSLSSAVGIVNYVLNDATLEKRRFPYRTNFTCGVVENTSIKLPEELEVASLPTTPSIESASLAWKNRLSATRGRINAANYFYCRNVSLQPNEYQLLRKIKREIADNARRKPILSYHPALKEVQGIGVAANKIDYGAEILDQKYTVVVQSAYTALITKRLKIAITSYKGVKDWSEMCFEYFPAFEKIEVTDCKVTNGDVVTFVPREMIRSMDTSYSAAAPRYPEGKQLVVAFPGVEVGSVLELTVHQELSQRSFQNLVFCARDYVPIRQMTFEFHIPMGMKAMVPQLHPNGLLAMNSDEALPQFKSRKSERLSNATESYTWTCSDMPAVRTEDKQPELAWFCPTFTITNKTWPDYAQILQRQIESLPTFASADALSNSAIGAFGKKLIQQFPDSPYQRIIAIRQWIDDHIRLVQPFFNRLPLNAISDPCTTFRDGYGNSMDRALLFDAMLRAAECPKAALYLAYSLEHPDAQRALAATPGVGDFSQCILRVEAENQEIWLNDQSKYSQFGTCAYDRGLLLELSTGRLQTLTMDDDMADIQKRRLEIEIDTFGKATITTTTTVSGSRFGKAKQKYTQMTAEEKRRDYQAMVTAVSASATPKSEQLKTEFAHYPGEYSYTVEIENYAIMDKGRCLFSIKCPSPPELAGCRLDKRTTPLLWGHHTRTETSIHVKVPVDYQEVLLAPSNYYWRAPEGGSIAWRCRQLPLTKGCTTIEFEITFTSELTPALILTRDYPRIREVLRRLSHPSNTTFVLQKKPQAGER